MLAIMQCPECGHTWQRRDARSDLNISAMSVQYRAGATLRQVAKTHGCAYNTARQRLIRAGVQLRLRNGAAKAVTSDGVR